MPSDLIHYTLRRRPHAQHRQAARVDLRPARILDHLGRDAQAPRLAQQLFDLVEALGLHGNLGLAEALPSREKLGGGARGAGFARGAGEVLVASKSRVGTLGCDFAYYRGEVEGSGQSILLIMMAIYMVAWERGKAQVAPTYLLSYPNPFSQPTQVYTPPRYPAP